MSLHPSCDSGEASKVASELTGSANLNTGKTYATPEAWTMSASLVYKQFEWMLFSDDATVRNVTRTVAPTVYC